jgi:hypothetical protein
MAVSYVIGRRGAGKGHQQPETNGLTVVVETSSEREQRDKYITVGGLKLWRNSEPPHTAFYAHRWVGPGKTFEAWRVEWDRFCGETTFLPRYQHRNDATERALRSWFAWVADLAKPEQLTQPLTSAGELVAVRRRRFPFLIYLAAHGINLPRIRQNLTQQQQSTTTMAAAHRSGHSTDDDARPGPQNRKPPSGKANHLGHSAASDARPASCVCTNPSAFSAQEALQSCRMGGFGQDSPNERRAAYSGSDAGRNDSPDGNQGGMGRACERMLPLSEEEALDQFEAWRDAMSWAETTSAQYWAALRKAAFILNISLSNLYKIQGKVLGYAAKEADERRPTIPAQQAEIETTASTLTAPLSLLLRIAFALGQRVGDVSQLQTKRITTMHDPVTQQEFVCLQFRRGKTTRRRQPFTLHLPLSTPEASELWERAQTHKEDLLFVADRGLGLRTIAVALKKTSPELCLLSVRRGGATANGTHWGQHGHTPAPQPTHDGSDARSLPRLKSST